MKYEKVQKARFIERENRFVARVEDEMGDKESRVHVKNTGRCRELLVSGATVYLEDHMDSMRDRKYRYSLIAVEKETEAGTFLINMDSQAPNKVVAEALEAGAIIDGATTIRPETTFGSSRFDFYVEAGEGDSTRRAFIEVKGVTLEEDGIARFPDAPTERGVKHINELIAAREEGYEAYIVFVIQMKGMKCFEPNDETHPQFGEALRRAKAMGVQVLVYDCTVTEDSLELDQTVPVRL